MELALTATGSNLPSLAIPQQLPVTNIHLLEFTETKCNLEFMLSFGMHRVTCHQGCHWNPCHTFTIFNQNYCWHPPVQAAQLLVWFQLRAVLQVKAAILYPAVHFLPDYLIRIQIQISETLHSCSWLIFLQNMSKPFFRPRLQGQFFFGDFWYIYIAFLSWNYRICILSSLSGKYWF